MANLLVGDVAVVLELNTFPLLSAAEKPTKLAAPPNGEVAVLLTEKAGVLPVAEIKLLPKLKVYVVQPKTPALLYCKESGVVTHGGAEPTTNCPLPFVPTRLAEIGMLPPFTFATPGFGKVPDRSPPAGPVGGPPAPEP